LALLRPTFDARRPTALLMGRFQPFHDGHRRLVKSTIARVGQACIAVRDTHGVDAKNPLCFFDVKSRIEAGLRDHAGRFVVIAVPNITHVFYGRDVGYAIERIDLDTATEAISATAIREQIAGV
jgi:nicotinic acid mononucleotide adenylyltransferase